MPRIAGGSYILPTSNPVATGTVIRSEWANDTMDDIAVAMTDSLSRSGLGNMLVPFRVPDGSVGQPSLSFLNNTQSGLYIAAPNDVRMSIGGVDVCRWFNGKVQQWSGSEWLDLYQPPAT